MRLPTQDGPVVPPIDIPATVTQVAEAPAPKAKKDGLPQTGATKRLARDQKALNATPQRRPTLTALETKKSKTRVGGSHTKGGGKLGKHGRVRKPPTSSQPLGNIEAGLTVGAMSTAHSGVADLGSAYAGLE